MLRVSLSKFQDTPGKYIDSDEFPIELTRHGKTVAYIVKDFVTTTTSSAEKMRSMSTVQYTYPPKMETFDSGSVDLETCKKHGVYKKTCGCWGGENK